MHKRRGWTMTKHRIYAMSFARVYPHYVGVDKG
jgi:hypothetical protein